MFQPLAVCIGLRYTRAKRRNHFISFIALTSMIGIALGVMVLITVLSVMNGFDEEIRQRIFGMASQVTISGVNSSLHDWQVLSQKIEKNPQVIGTAPLVAGQGILINQGQPHPVMAIGILPQREAEVSSIAKKFIAGSLNKLQPHQFGIVLGEELALTLGVDVGDRVNLMIPSVAVTPVAIVPRFRSFTVEGIFRVGRGFGFDSLAYIHLQDAQALFQLGNTVSGLRLKLKDLYKAPQVAEEVAQQLPNIYQVSNWTQEYGSIIHAIALEKTMMFVILLLLIAISAFNLVSSLMMVVTDKRADIAILRTLGATPKAILSIFMVQGLVIGMIGTLIGLVAGLALAANVSSILNLIEHVFHVQLFNSNVYFFVDQLPSKIESNDVIHICLAALSMSFLATIYPAWRAARTDPAEALRYE